MKKIKRKMGLQLRIFLYLLMFSTLLLGILWFTQTVYIGSIYRSTKTREAAELMSAITEKLSSDPELLVKEDAVEARKETLDELIEGLDVRLIVSDSSYQIRYSSGDLFTTALSYVRLPEYFELAKASGGSLTFYTSGDARKDELPETPGTADSNADSEDDSENGPPAGGFVVISPNRQGRGAFPTPINESSFNFFDSSEESLISMSMIRINGEDYLVLLTTLITPIEETIVVLKYILVVVTIAMILGSIFIAWLLSHQISKPIKDISGKARKLAEGDYTEVYPESRTKEIAELSESLNYASHELEQTERLQRELIANVSHDLRTPLTMIKGYAELMRDIPGESTPENMQIVIDETERLNALVNDILDVSRIQAGMTVANKKRYSLTKSIGQVLDRYAKLVSQEGFEIRFEKDQEVFVEADEGMIFQVIYNLINNAISYTGDGNGVKVSQVVVDNMVTLSIRDYGQGIAQEEIPYVWDRYYRSRDRHVRSKIGSGLGLSIVKGVLELHQAEYGVESYPGEGTVFWFRLPIAGDTNEGKMD